MVDGDVAAAGAAEVACVARPASTSRARTRGLLVGGLVAGDFAALVAAAASATLLRFGNMWVPVVFNGTSGGLDYGRMSALALVCLLASLWLERLYDLERLFWGGGEFTRIVRGVCVGTTALVIVTYLMKEPGLSQLWLILLASCSACLMFLSRLSARAVVGMLRARGHLTRRTLIAGCNPEAESLAELLTKDASAGYEIVGTVGGHEMIEADRAPAPLATCDRILEVVATHSVDTVVVASSAFKGPQLSKLLNELRRMPLDVHVSSGVHDLLPNRLLVGSVSGIPLLTVRPVSLSPLAIAAKRAFDFTAACALVVVGLPLWIALAVAIRVTSDGPFFYRQERVGLRGRRFDMLKFRSMHADAEERLEDVRKLNEASGPLFKARLDPRVTPIGRWMRKSSLDEIPQLLNVIRGEMSLVGPRPPLPAEVESYSERDWQRLDVRPGMTGLWQVSGRSNLPFDEMVRLDLFYIENWSVWWDLGLIARTVPVVVLGKGAY